MTKSIMCKECLFCEYSKSDWTNKNNTDHYCANTDSENYGYNIEMISHCDRQGASHVRKEKV